MDLKGRVTVPSKFREDLGDKFYVCKGLDGCLFLLSQAQWDKLVEKVSAIPLAQGKGIQPAGTLTTRARPTRPLRPP